MHNKYKGPERRRATRVRAEFIVIYRIDRPMEVRMWIGNRDVNAKMLDLSEIGMAILTNYDIPTSAILLIKFTLINLYSERDERVRTMEIVGEVMDNVSTKKNEHRLGIAFTKIAQEDKSAIASFVRMVMSR